MKRQRTDFDRLVAAVNRTLRSLRGELGIPWCRPVDAGELSAFVLKRFAAFSLDNQDGGTEFRVDTPELLAWHLADERVLDRTPREEGPERNAALDARSAVFGPVFYRLKHELRKRQQDRAAEFERLKRGDPGRVGEAGRTR